MLNPTKRRIILICIMIVLFCIGLIVGLKIGLWSGRIQGLGEAQNVIISYLAEVQKAEQNTGLLDSLAVGNDYEIMKQTLADINTKIEEKLGK